MSAHHRGPGLFTKVLVALAVLGGCFTGYGVLSVTSVGRMDDAARTLEEHSMGSMAFLGDAYAAVAHGREVTMRATTLDAFSVGDTPDGERAELDRQFDDYHAAFGTALDAYLAKDPGPAAASAAREAAQLWDRYRSVREQELLPASRSGDQVRARRALTTATELAEGVTGALREADRQTLAGAHEVASHVHATSSRTRTVLAVALVTLLGLLVTIGTYTIVVVRRAGTRVRRVADLLYGSARTMAATSEALSGVAADTAGRSNRVAAAAEEVSASVTTVASAAEELSAAASEIAGNTARAATVAIEGAALAATSADVVARLSSSSLEISRVTEVISSIAEATNLLALNATIEAARAGESGSGFAIVAAEVKDLATETAAATGDIAARVRTIQSDARMAVDAMAQIADVIQEVSALQNGVSSAVEEQSATTNEIGRNVTEAATGSSIIAADISAVAIAAQATTADAETTREAATTLGRYAAELEQHVALFRF